MAKTKKPFISEGVVTIGRVNTGGKREEVKGEVHVKELVQGVPFTKSLVDKFGTQVKIRVEEIIQIETEPEEPDLDIE